MMFIELSVRKDCRFSWNYNLRSLSRCMTDLSLTKYLSLYTLTMESCACEDTGQETYRDEWRMTKDNKCATKESY